MPRRMEIFWDQTASLRLLGRALRTIVATSAGIVMLFGDPAVAADNKPLAWNWKFQKRPMASSFEYCSTNAPQDPAAKDKSAGPWPKVLETIRAAANKWKYAKKNAKPNETLFQFRISSDDCPQCPGLNYIDFGPIKDTAAPAETTYVGVPGTSNMKKCAIRFNSAVSWHVMDDDPKPNEFDLQSVALREFGHCVGLDNVSTGSAVMSVGLKAGEKRRELQPDDIAGRNSIYGDP